MKVLLISSMEAVGGTERATQQLASVLAEGGHTVHLLGTDGPLVPAIEQLGVTVHLTETHGRSIAAVAGFFRDALRLIRVERFDCVHVQMARPVPLIAAAHWLAGRPGKVIWHARGLHAATYRYIARLFEALGVRCIANCRTERDKLIRNGYRAEHIGYLYNPCLLEDIELPPPIMRERLGIPPDAVVIGSLSRLAADRGVDYAIRYFHTLAGRWSSTRPLYLVIGGDGPERKQLEEMARAGAGADRILFLGAVNRVIELYAAMDVFWNTIAIHGDNGAGTGNTTIEAAFCRVPVVTHAGAGIGELIEDGVTGALVQVGDEERFITATMTALTDNGYRERTVAAAWRRVKDLCGKEAFARQLEANYREL